MKLASFFLRWESLVFPVVRVCAHMCVCVCLWKGKARGCIMTVKVYNHRYSKAQVPSQISVGISTNSGNIGHHKPVKAAIETPFLTCCHMPRFPQKSFGIQNFKYAGTGGFLSVCSRSKWLRVSCIFIPAGRLYVWKPWWFQTHTSPSCCVPVK